MPNPTDLPPPVQALQLITGSWVAHAVAVAARLALPDLVKDGPRSTADLAAATQTHEPSLHRLLRALASLGLFHETEPRTFGPTALSDCLTTKPAGSMRAMSLFTDHPAHREAWRHLLHSVRTGETAFVKAHGEGFFPYIQKHPELQSVFDQAMSSFASVTHDAVVQAYDFKPIRVLADVGGGYGSFLTDILKANPHLRGILYDQPQVIDGARKMPYLTAPELAGRIELKAGSFFDSVPAGADAYLMKHILHDWSDDLCLKILRHIHAALPKDGRLLVAENVLKPGNDGDFAKFLDLEMLVMTDGGKERGEAEFAALFADAGFRLVRVVRTESPICMVEGAKA